MLKIHQLFLRSFVLIFIAILVAVVLFSYFWLKNLHIKETEKSLINNIESFSVALASLDNLDYKVAKLKELTNLRVTIINNKGVVIAESDKDKKTMDNHLNREEILNINNDGFGKTIRKSGSINKDMINVVKKIIINDEILYIRMGDYLTTLESRFLSLTFQIGIIFAIFLLFGLIIIYLISKRLQQQTDKILHSLSMFNQRNGFNKVDLQQLEFKYIYEFDQIATYLKRVGLKLAKRDKQKQNYTENLKIANREKDEIISAISHEFKNPLSIISGYAQTLLGDDIPKNMRRNFLQKIDNSANKIVKLIDRLRLSIKLEQSSQNRLFTQVELSQLVGEVIEGLKLKYKTRDIEFISQNVTKDVDDALLYQAIENLIENALKYSKDEVIVTLNEKSLSITDKGIGIQKDELEKIKQKFYRISTNSWDNSLGLGLFIVQKILKLHDFKLEIQSKYGKGSSFIIIFK